MHVTWWTRVEWACNGGQSKDKKIITALTTSPQGWVFAHKCQCTMAITKVWSEFLWASPDCTAKASAWAMVDNKRTKVLITPPQWWFSVPESYLIHVTAWQYSQRIAWPDILMEHINLCLENWINGQKISDFQP